MIHGIERDNYANEPDRRGIRTYLAMPDTASATHGRSRGGLGEPMPMKRGGLADLPVLHTPLVRRAHKKPANALQRFAALVLRTLRGR